MLDKDLIEDVHQETPIKIIEEMLLIPNQLKDKEINIQSLKFKLAESRKRFDLWEINEVRNILEEETKASINTEDLKKKKKFPNLEIRKSELELRKSKSEEVKKLLEEKIKSDKELAELEIEFNYLKRKLNSLHSIILLIKDKRKK